MTDDDKRHMDTARRLARHAAEREWLAQAYETLGRQRAVLGALAEVQMLFGDKDAKLYDQCWYLRTHTAKVVLATCESIMRHSGLTDLDHTDWGDQAAAPSGEAREETVPW